MFPYANFCDVKIILYCLESFKLVSTILNIKYCKTVVSAHLLLVLKRDSKQGKGQEDNSDIIFLQSIRKTELIYKELIFYSILRGEITSINYSLRNLVVCVSARIQLYTEKHLFSPQKNPL